MNLALAILLVTAPLTEASHSTALEPGVYPAGVLIAAIGRLTEQPVHGSIPGLGNLPVELDRRLLVTPGHLAAMQSILFDSGIALERLDPDSEAPTAWLATLATAEHDRPIRLQVRVLAIRHAPVEEVAFRLNTIAKERETLLPPGDVPTHFVADPRTGSLIARYTSSERLESYLELLLELDRPAPSGEKTPVLRTYRPRHLRASDLLPLFEAEWDRAGGHAVRVIAPPQQNVLLVRCPLQTWEVIEPMLRRLDRRP